jgi:hypothetical protein
VQQTNCSRELLLRPATTYFSPADPAEQQSAGSNRRNASSHMTKLITYASRPIRHGCGNLFNARKKKFRRTAVV